MIEITCFRGSEIEPIVPELARLRTTVFREYPYLYDGGPEYEAEYLSMYTDSQESICVVATDGTRIVGASTAVPLDQAAPSFQRPFLESGIAPEDVFYFGESVLLKEYRGRGLGHRFFDEREVFAHELGRFSFVAFCAVDREADDPRRPSDYRPHDAFWQKRGFEKRSDLRTSFAWKEIDEHEASEKSMTFWLRHVRDDRSRDLRWPK